MSENKYKAYVEDKFPGKGLRPLSNSFMRKNFWISFGKYQDWHPWHIMDEDPGYYIWAFSNEKVKRKLPNMLLEFIRHFSGDIEALAAAAKKDDDDLFKKTKESQE